MERVVQFYIEERLIDEYQHKIQQQCGVLTVATQHHHLWGVWCVLSVARKTCVWRVARWHEDETCNLRTVRRICSSH